MPNAREVDCTIVAALRQSCCIENTQSAHLSPNCADFGTISGLGVCRVDVELSQPLAQRIAVDPESPRRLQLVATHLATNTTKERGFDDGFELFVKNDVVRRAGQLLTRPDRKSTHLNSSH